MSVNELSKMFEEAENTSDYQLQSTVVDLTEDICEIMEAKSITRADLARRLGKSRAWVTKLLRGDRNLTLRTIVEVLWELGYKVSVSAEPVGARRKTGAGLSTQPGVSRRRRTKSREVRDSEAIKA